MDVENALYRLKEFRKSWNDDDTIDEESRLSAVDLDVMIRWMDEARAGPA